MRVIGSAGEQLGILQIFEALRRAQEKGMDLVEVAPEGKPPVCRIMDYGRYRYEQAKKDREARKHQKSVDVKEIKLRPKIDLHDYQTKLRHVQRFLEDGHKVKVTIMFRGREMVHKELGAQILDRVVAEVSELGAVEQYPKLEGNNLSLLIASRPAGTKPKPAAPRPATASLPGSVVAVAPQPSERKG